MSAAILACNNDSCAAPKKTCDQAADVNFPCRKCESLEEELKEVRSSLDDAKCALEAKKAQIAILLDRPAPAAQGEETNFNRCMRIIQTIVYRLHYCTSMCTASPSKMNY